VDWAGLRLCDQRKGTVLGHGERWHLPAGQGGVGDPPGAPAPVTSARTAAATAAAASGVVLVHLVHRSWLVRSPTLPVDPCALILGTNAHQERRMREPAGHAGPPTPGRSWLPPATRRQGRGAGRTRGRTGPVSGHEPFGTPTTERRGGQGPLPAEIPLPADLRVNWQQPHHRTLNQDRRVRVVTCWVHATGHRMTLRWLQPARLRRTGSSDRSRTAPTIARTLNPDFTRQ
jgi:hypothetical protein